MTSIVGLMVFLAAPVFQAEGGLVANRGFEDSAGGLPVRWNAFVMPQEGAVGKLDRNPLSGEYAAMLHTPLPYDKEPTNNWSQNIIAELSGKKLRLSGHIKTREATEAAIWVQCWQKRPLRLLKLVNSSTDAPMYGTREWEEVTAEFTVPANTDFLTLRCVLLGTGTAWFDDIDLAEASKADEDEAAPEDEAKQDKAPSEGAFRIKVVGPDGVEYPEVTLGTPESHAEEGDIAALMAQLEAEIGRLSEANMALADALDEIRADNAQLMDEVLTLRLELREAEARQSGEARRTAGNVVLDPPKLPGVIAPGEGRKD